METRQITLESKQDTLTYTLTNLLTNFSSQTTNTTPKINFIPYTHPISFDATYSIPPPTSDYSQNLFTTSTSTTIPPFYTHIPIPPIIRSPKIQLFFYGTNPLDWLFHVDQFFQFYNIPFDSCLHITAFYM